MINISGLDKGAVLAALWNNASVPPSSDPDADTIPMTTEAAQSVFLYRRVSNGQTGEAVYGFDYFSGRLLKVNLAGDELDPWGYDRDNGQGLAERVITHLRRTGSVERLASS
jgi:hypothetical protein